VNVPDNLPEYVRRLIRPRLALRTQRPSPSDALAGVWGGTGVVPLPAASSEARHWISVDCGWLERNGFGVKGCLSVYEVGSLDIGVLNDPGWAFPERVADGIPLFGREEESLPDSQVFEAYLTEAENGAVEGEVGADYFTCAQANCPLYDGAIAAVLGGWHVGWPDGPPNLPRLRVQTERIDAVGGPGVMPEGETYRCEPYRLVLWTFRDAEPWVEVWGDGAGELHAVARIT
jgi:hypothetical protein